MPLLRTLGAALLLGLGLSSVHAAPRVLQDDNNGICAAVASNAVLEGALDGARTRVSQLLDDTQGARDVLALAEANLYRKEREQRVKAAAVPVAQSALDDANTALLPSERCRIESDIPATCDTVADKAAAITTAQSALATAYSNAEEARRCNRANADRQDDCTDKTDDWENANRRLTEKQDDLIAARLCREQAGHDDATAALNAAKVDRDAKKFARNDLRAAYDAKRGDCRMLVLNDADDASMRSCASEERDLNANLQTANDQLDRAEQAVTAAQAVVDMQTRTDAQTTIEPQTPPCTSAADADQNVADAQQAVADAAAARNQVCSVEAQHCQSNEEANAALLDAFEAVDAAQKASDDAVAACQAARDALTAFDDQHPGVSSESAPCTEDAAARAAVDAAAAALQDAQDQLTAANAALRDVALPRHQAAHEALQTVLQQEDDGMASITADVRTAVQRNAAIVTNFASLRPAGRRMQSNDECVRNCDAMDGCSTEKRLCEIDNMICEETGQRNDLQAELITYGNGVCDRFQNIAAATELVNTKITQLNAAAQIRDAANADASAAEQAEEEGMAQLDAMRHCGGCVFFSDSVQDDCAADEHCVASGFFQDQRFTACGASDSDCITEAFLNKRGEAKAALDFQNGEELASPSRPLLAARAAKSAAQATVDEAQDALDEARANLERLQDAEFDPPSAADYSEMSDAFTAFKDSMIGCNDAERAYWEAEGQWVEPEPGVIQQHGGKMLGGLGGVAMVGAALFFKPKRAFAPLGEPLSNPLAV